MLPLQHFPSLRPLLLASILVAAVAMAGCANKGLVTESNKPDFYRMKVHLPSDTLAEHPSFLVLGDTQMQWRVRHRFLRKSNWLTWKQLAFPFYQLYLLGEGAAGAFNWYVRHMPTYGDQGRGAIRKATNRELRSNKDIDFVLTTGDIAAADGRRPAHWEAFLEENRQDPGTLGHVPYLPVAGNHDRTTDSTYGLPNFKAVFDREPFYTIDFRNGAIFVLDSNPILDWKDEMTSAGQRAVFRKWFINEDPDEPAWLERQLAARADKDYKIVALHHQPISFGNRAGQWTATPWTTEARNRLLRLFQQYDVRVVFAGHEHLYEHNTLHYEQNDQARVMHFVTSSGGGGALRELVPQAQKESLARGYRQTGLDVTHHRQERTFHYSLADVTSSRLRIRTYAVPHDLEHPDDVRLLDTVTIPRHPSADSLTTNSTTRH